MHRLLHVQEILLEIFYHCYNCRSHEGKADLVALARTCKTFKEPALDVLWTELTCLTPLVRCLPDALGWDPKKGCYSLKRSLGQADWDIILGITHRVRVCRLDFLSLGTECIEELSKPPSSIVPIFPKLHEIAIAGPQLDVAPLLQHFASPILTVVRLEHVQTLGDAINVLGERCPNVTTFEYTSAASQEKLIGIISHLILQWPRLHFVHCIKVPLNAPAIVHLSHLDGLWHLAFELRDAMMDRIQSDQSGPLVFQTLTHFESFARSLDTICKFFDQFLKLTAIETLNIRPQSRPTEQQLKAFFSILPKICNHESLHSISVSVNTFRFQGPYSMTVNPLPPYFINVKHLYPLTVFANIRTVNFRIPCSVDLNEGELLQLVSSWPRLETFNVGTDGTASSMITPEGFVRLLERCRSLHCFHFMFDTRGYVEVPQGHPWHGLKTTRNMTINVCRSPIAEESIGALGVFFHVAPFPEFRLDDGWRGVKYARDPLLRKQSDLNRERWERVRKLAFKLWEQRNGLSVSLRNQGLCSSGHTGRRDSNDSSGVN